MKNFEEKMINILCEEKRKKMGKRCLVSFFSKKKTSLENRELQLLLNAPALDGAVGCVHIYVIHTRVHIIHMPYCSTYYYSMASES